VIDPETRRIGWIVVGLVGLPGAALGAFYLVGPIYLIVIALVALVLSRWSSLDHLIVALASMVWAYKVIDTMVQGGRLNGHGIGLPWSLVLLTSGLAMTAAAAKLGRIAGIRSWGAPNETEFR
jgi:hypothetical protein